MSFVKAIALLYGGTGVAIIGSYIPQVRAIWRSEDGARDISLVTWSFWVLTATVSCFYAGFVVGDRGVLLMAIGNFTGCSSVAGSAAWRRYSARRRALNRPADLPRVSI